MYIWLLYVYNRCLLCCSFLLIFYYEFYYSFYYKATENRGKQRITEDNGTFTEYREKAQKRYVSGLLKWLYYIIHEQIVYTRKACICIHNLPPIYLILSIFIRKSKVDYSPRNLYTCLVIFQEREPLCQIITNIISHVI